MAATAAPLQPGFIAPDFDLPGVDGRRWRYADVAGPRGTLVMFICNHCPYVQAVADRIVRDATALRELGIGAAAINSNDAAAYPADGFGPMVDFARQHRFGFPYLHDESQQVARAYGAVCTPDFFGFNAGRELVYRGRLDSSGRQPAGPDARRELFEALQAVALTGRAPAQQIASIGCSIKWRDEAAG